MIKALVVEDEPLARDELVYLLKRCSNINIIGECDSVEQSYDYLLNGEVDVVFLDIELGEQNGLQLAEFIQKQEHPPEIIFATAYDEYALHAFKVEAIDYLLKPFDEERLAQAINKVEKICLLKQHTNLVSKTNHQNNSPSFEKLAVTSEDRIKIISIDDIIYISAQNGKTSIATSKEVFPVTSTLIQLEQRLKTNDILRVHRSFLVNKNKIKEIEPYFNSTFLLCMQDGEKIPVSRNYTKELKQTFGF